MAKSKSSKASRRGRGWRILGFSLLGLVVLLGGALIFITHHLPVVEPAPDLHVDVSDTAQVARGRYLTENVLACAQCHSPRDWTKFSGPVPVATANEGAVFPRIVEDMPGRLYGANITPYFTRHYTDGQLYRLITAGITNHDEPVFPTMNYDAMGHMDPRDVKAVVAYLRTLPEKAKDSPASELDFPFMLVKRIIPHEAQPMSLDTLDTPALQGKYLVEIVHCAFCHSPVDGQMQPKPDSLFAGGHRFLLPSGGIVYSANLTASKSGIGGWSEDDFVRRFTAYRDPASIHPVAPNTFNTVMSWSRYANMKEQDLRDIYQYLRTFPPIETHHPKFRPDPAGVAVR